MRRSALALLTAALLSLTLVSPFSGASAGPVTQSPGSTTVNGKLSVEPNPPTIGQGVKVGANFSNGLYKVTLYRQLSGSSSWTEVAVDDSNEFGNAWFYDVQIDAKQKLYARITEGKTGITNTMTITPTVPVEPNANPTGELYTQPEAFAEGQPVEVVANFPNGTFDVSLYRKVSGVWNKVGTDTKRRTSGNAYFKGFVVKEGEELFALRSNGESTAAESFAPVEILPENFPEAPGSTLTILGKVYDGRKGTVVANFPSGTFDVTVFRNKGGTWVPEGTSRSNSSGDASISIEFDGGDDYFALASNGQRTPEKELVPSPPSDVSGGPATLGHNVIYVTTNNGGTPTTRGVDYESKAVLESGGVETETLDVEEFAVRGNSTSTKPKKPYKIKFEDDLEPFGMAEDNNFVLLANYLDWTLVRTEVAFNLGRQLQGLALPWTPRSAYAEVFLNGKYMGSYQMVESIKLDKNRVKVADKKTAQIIEFDPHYKEDGVPGMSGQTGVKYSWKDPDEFKFFDPGEKTCPEDATEPCPDPEGLTTDKINKMKAKINHFEDVLYGDGNTRNWATYQPPTPADDWKTYLDLDSAVDYYLVKEFTKDQDADMFRSNYFYTNNVDPNSTDKFYMGPLWDFDRSAGATPDNYFTGVSKPTGWWMRGDGSVEHETNKIHWFTRIAKDPVFLDRLEERWAETRHFFEDAGRAGDAPGGEVSKAVSKIGGNGDYQLGRTVAENDRARWKGYGSRYEPKTSNYAKEVEWLRGWYDKRFAWMDGELG